MRVEWDPVKARLNIARRGISFKKASSVFGDPLAITISDVNHSDHEQREITLGMSSIHRLLVVYHVDRGGWVRIIGARLPSRYERWGYEEERRA
jgi:uncharacterized protein